MTVGSIFWQTPHNHFSHGDFLSSVSTMVDYPGADEYGAADELKHLRTEASQGSSIGELQRAHEYPSRVAPKADCSLFKAAGSRAPSTPVSPTINNTLVL